MNILVVEDDVQTADLLQIGLEAEKYTVTIAVSAEDGRDALDGSRYDVVLLDLELPGQGGIDLLKALRAEGEPTPVIITTALAEVGKRIEGLDAGADDYIVKPIRLHELLARIRAVTRRARDGNTSSLCVADLQIDRRERRVYRGGREITLTEREFDLLVYLASHPGQIVARETLAEYAWQKRAHSLAIDNLVSVYVSRLREKIDKGSDETLIHTVRGRGILLREPTS
mgnify:CR=1 FL=1|jgi:DNA-binding response OmpR family regulator